MIVTITPLGTVSPYCKEEHNCPGFLINYKDYKILLDCECLTRYLHFPTDLNNLSVIITYYHARMLAKESNASKLLLTHL